MEKALKILCAKKTTPLRTSPAIQQAQVGTLSYFKDIIKNS
jgi:hypothetical protein